VIFLKKKVFQDESFEMGLNELCDFINNLPPDIVCLLPICHMCNVLNTTMLSLIASKEILLIVKNTNECVPYIKKRVTKVTDNDDDNTRTAGFSK